jgi:hypothetical protein
MEPPITALLEEQDTASPSSEPFPYSWDRFDKRLHCPQLIMEAMSPPVPGMIPTILEMNKVNIFKGKASFNSLKLRNFFLDFVTSLILSICL